MKPTQVRLRYDIQRAFREAKLELLPEELQQDTLAQWIVNFDSLNTARGRELQRADRDREPLDAIVQNIIIDALNPNITFYFATLFHIGRRWEVSRRAAADAEQALMEDNLKATLSANSTIYLQTEPRERHEVEESVDYLDAIKSLLHQAQNSHNGLVKNSKRLWNIWREEVSALYGVTNKLVNSYRHNQPDSPHWRDLPLHLSNLITYSYATGDLYRRLSNDNIKLNFPPPANLLNNVSIVALLALFDRRWLERGGIDPHFFFRDLFEQQRELLGRQADLLERQKITPVLQQVQSNLLERFSSENPFPRYAALKAPPDSQLKELWDECRLPDGSMFFYAQKWLSSLGEKIYFWSSDLPYKSSLEQGDCVSYALSADSTLKRTWVESR